jgi:hypothetical protein
MISLARFGSGGGDAGGCWATTSAGPDSINPIAIAMRREARRVRERREPHERGVIMCSCEGASD